MEGKAPYRELDRWTAKMMAGGVAYYPSEEDKEKVGIALHERVRPLRPARVAIEETLALLRRVSEGIALGPVERQTTDGGEYAAIATATATSKLDGKSIHYVFAFVYGDEWYDRYDGWTVEDDRAAELETIIREAIRKHVLRLGLLRARRFYYEPPPGWQPLTRGLITEWYPLDFPKHYSVIFVPPAFPGNVQPSASAEAIFIRRTMLFTQKEPAREENIILNGLGGMIVDQLGHYEIEHNPVTHIHTLALKDPNKHYTYLFRLETTDEWLMADQVIFNNMTKSLQAIPSMARAKAAEEMTWVID